MQRIAFQLRIKVGMTEEYDEVHRHVWPELLAEMESFGITDYSIFRQGQQLFLYLRVPDYDQMVKQLSASEINQRWQQKMAPFFEAALDLQGGENQARMREVFFMQGNTGTSARAQSEEKPTR